MGWQGARVPGVRTWEICLNTIGSGKNDKRSEKHTQARCACMARRDTTRAKLGPPQAQRSVNNEHAIQTMFHDKQKRWAHMPTRKQRSVNFARAAQARQAVALQEVQQQTSHTHYATADTAQITPVIASSHAMIVNTIYSSVCFFEHLYML